MSKLVLSRRHMLKGCRNGLVCSLALPVLDIMLNNSGEAFSDDSPFPTRFILFFWGNGVRPETFYPAQIGANYQLSTSLAPLMPVKDYVSVLSGFNGSSGTGQHAAGVCALLSGSPYTYSGPPKNSTIDQFVASHLGKSSLFPSLEIGVSKALYFENLPFYNSISCRNGLYNPVEFDPKNLFNRLFANFGIDEAKRQKLMNEGKVSRSVVDLVKEDGKRLKKLLGLEDQKRIDAHLESVFQLEKRLEKQEKSEADQCKIPGTPPISNIGSRQSENVKEINRAMAEIVALAFSCDLTRVATIQFSGPAANTLFPDISSTDHHSATHSPNLQNAVSSMTTRIMEHFSELLQVLKNTALGTGNLLDSTLIYATSEMSIAETHSTVNHPILIAGKANGALKYPGIHVAGNGLGTDLALATIVKALKLPLDSYDLRNKNTVNELLNV
ncbi:DUF1552 domain-containing protein [Oligoflexus tunisiensis]|uniref:DUF1552 domain-containing protein n=1 Tax=Oligoflexus tunisiensis TaxID=708132 RepID=UPI00114D1EEE|nr:DUF1552 domain-containing protein [Oligoflexus tunisiensis]